MPHSEVSLRACIRPFPVHWPGKGGMHSLLERVSMAVAIHNPYPQLQHCHCQLLVFLIPEMPPAHPYPLSAGGQEEWHG